MGSDGSFVKHNGSVGGGGKIFLPSGKGGGCITNGPFKVVDGVQTDPPHEIAANSPSPPQNIQTHLGPNSPTMAGEVKVTEKFVYNPRCMKRDLVRTHLSTERTNNTL
jgi:tyrosinase